MESHSDMNGGSNGITDHSFDLEKGSIHIVITATRSWSHNKWVQIQALPFSSCVMLGKLLSLGVFICEMDRIIAPDS